MRKKRKRGKWREKMKRGLRRPHSYDSRRLLFDKAALAGPPRGECRGRRGVPSP